MAVIQSPLSKALQGGLVQRTVSSGSVFGGGLRLDPVRSGLDAESLAVANQNASDIISIKEQVANLQQQVFTLVQQNSKLTSEIGQLSAVKNQINTIQNQVSSLSTTVAQISGKPLVNPQINQLTTETQQNKNTIVNLQKQVSDLSDQNRQIILGVTNNITQIQGQVNGLQEQIVDFSSALDRIAVYITNSNIVDQQRERYQIEQERRYAEIGLRRGKEKSLEYRIQEALTEPVKMIGKKFQLGLGNMLQALYWIFGGWLTNQVIDLMKSYSNKDWKLFDEIKDNIIRNTLSFIRGIGFIKTGFGKLIGGIFSLAKMIGKFLIVNPIKAAFGGLGKLLGLGGKEAAATTAESAAKTAEGAAKTAEVAGEASKGAKILGVGGDLLKGAGKVASRFAPGVNTLVDTGLSAYSFKEGNVASGALYGAAALTGAFGLEPLSWAFAGGGLITDAFYGGKKKDQSKQPPPKSKTPTQLSAPSGGGGLPAQTTPVSQPQTLMMPSSTASSPATPTTPIQTADTSQVPAAAKIAPVSTPSTPLTPQSGAFGVDAYKFGVDTGNKIPNLTPAQTQQLPKQAPPGPEPPAPPNIVYTQNGTSKPKGPSGPEPTRGDPVSDVPNIPSSDPDNFYTLYSQVHYNVVTV